MSEEAAHRLSGIEAPWYKGWNISEERREFYRRTSAASRRAKEQALRGDLDRSVHPINEPRLNPDVLMPRLPNNGIRALSLFSGGGGLDLGFEQAGFVHCGSYDVLEVAGETLLRNRPLWTVYSGDSGDVCHIDWRELRGRIDVVYGGPPCQPFSAAGRQLGEEDARDMLPQFVRAVQEMEPVAFLMENVAALRSKKFERYLGRTFLQPLDERYLLTEFQVDATSFGVPQVRRRLFFIGIRRDSSLSRYRIPNATHYAESAGKEGHGMGQQGRLLQDEPSLARVMGAREALGLPSIDFDCPAPTLRSGLTGPRHTTSILSSTAASEVWAKLQIWPNGVQPTREKASAFPAKDGHFRLSVSDCALLQGFPASWKLEGAVHKSIGLIGNSVAPPVAYRLTEALAQSFSC